MTTENRIFTSKISWVIVVLLIVISGVSGYWLLLQRSWWGLFIFALVVAFVAQMFLTTNYRIEGDYMIIRCGFLYRLRIDVRTIQRIEETRNPLSAPALSLDRLEIFYGRYDSVLVSPRDKETFITCLQNIAPKIHVKRRL